MKKKNNRWWLLTALLAALLLSGCGKEKTAETSAESSQVQETTRAVTGPTAGATAPEGPGKTEQETAEESGFTLLDVTPELVDAGYYLKDDELGVEMVFSVFHAPDNTPMVSMLSIGAEPESFEAACGITSQDNKKEADAEWTVYSFEDVYSEKECTISLGAYGDGKYAVITAEGKRLDAVSLDQNETVQYMGAVIRLANQE